MGELEGEERGGDGLSGGEGLDGRELEGEEWHDEGDEEVVEEGGEEAPQSSAASETRVGWGSVGLVRQGR